MNYVISLREKPPIRPGILYDHVAVAELAGVTVRRLLHYWRYDIIQPELNTGRYGIFFNDEAIYIIRRSEYLRKELGLDYLGIRVLLRSQKRIEELEAELRFLRA